MNRNEFIKSVGIAFVGLALGASAASAQSPLDASPDMVKAGCGGKGGDKGAGKAGCGGKKAGKGKADSKAKGKGMHGKKGKAACGGKGGCGAKK